MRPSVRGAEGVKVVGLLLASGALSAGALGLLAGAAWSLPGWGPLPTPVVAGVALAAVVLDLLARRAGWARPPAVRRQVPQLWGRLFGAGTVAVLYGARLGIGPATILTSWTWWAALVVGASVGPWPSAAVGAVFVLARTATMLGAVGGVRSGPAMGARVAAVRRLETAVALACALLVVLAVAACSDGEPDAPPTDRPSGDANQETSEPGELTLEPSTTTTTTPEDVALSELLIDEALPGFARADETVGAGPLDLEAAARAEQDVEAERALLETTGFRRGASRAWVSTDGEDVAYVAAYEFGDDAGAAAYLADGTETLLAREAVRFDVPDVPGALGFTTVEDGQEGVFTAHAVAFTRGPRWFLVLVGSPSSGRTSDEARSLARAQDARAA